MTDRAEEAIDQDRLHVVSALEADRAEQESEHPDVSTQPAKLMGFKAVEPEPNFEWGPGNEDVIMPEQRSTAVYANKWGQIVIRQERAWDEEDDTFVFIHPDHVDALVERLMVYKARAVRET